MYNIKTGRAAIIKHEFLKKGYDVKGEIITVVADTDLPYLEMKPFAEGKTKRVYLQNINNIIYV